MLAPVEWLILFEKKMVFSRGALQEMQTKFRFVIHPQGIWQFHKFLATMLLFLYVIIGQ